MTSTGSMVQKSTLAYEFYLDLREGHMIPIQDTKTIKFKTSADLQK